MSSDKYAWRIYTLPLPAGTPIRERGEGRFFHVGILVGYPADFLPHIPADRLGDVTQQKLLADHQYVISKRSGEEAPSFLPGSHSSSGGTGGRLGSIVLEEILTAFPTGATRCEIDGERYGNEETVRRAVGFLLHPGAAAMYNPFTENGQHFVTMVAVKGGEGGRLVADQWRDMGWRPWMPLPAVKQKPVLPPARPPYMNRRPTPPKLVICPPPEREEEWEWV